MQEITAREISDNQYWDDVRAAMARKGKYTKRQSSPLKELSRRRTREEQEATMSWWKRQVKSLGNIDPNSLYITESKMARQGIIAGRLYMFFYDAKHKKTLPYYDRFPLVWVFETDGNSFKGLNVHYLPMAHRLKLLEAFQKLATDDRYDIKTRVLISWSILKNYARFPQVRPSVKMYLKGHVRSKYILVHPNDWIAAHLLPTEQFRGASKRKVWQDSKDIMKKRR